MTHGIDIGEHDGFDVSTSDFVDQARTSGWRFWRGVIVGFSCAFPITYGAIVGVPFFGIGA